MGVGDEQRSFRPRLEAEFVKRLWGLCTGNLEFPCTAPTVVIGPRFKIRASVAGVGADPSAVPADAGADARTGRWVVLGHGRVVGRRWYEGCHHISQIRAPAHRDSPAGACAHVGACGAARRQSLQHRGHGAQGHYGRTGYAPFLKRVFHAAEYSQARTVRGCARVRRSLPQPGRRES